MVIMKQTIIEKGIWKEKAFNAMWNEKRGWEENIPNVGENIVLFKCENGKFYFKDAEASYERLDIVEDGDELDDIDLYEEYRPSLEYATRIEDTYNRNREPQYLNGKPIYKDTEGNFRYLAGRNKSSDDPLLSDDEISMAYLHLNTFRSKDGYLIYKDEDGEYWVDNEHRILEQFEIENLEYDGYLSTESSPSYIQAQEEEERLAREREREIEEEEEHKWDWY